MHGYPALVTDQWLQSASPGTLQCNRIGCGEKMRISTIEPGEQGFDIRTFECPRCQDRVTEVVKIRLSDGMSDN